MDALIWDKWILLAAFLLDIFFKIIWEAFHDHTLQMYMLISPHCLCILLDSQTVETLRSACIFMCHLVMLSFSKSILGQAV